MRTSYRQSDPLQQPADALIVPAWQKEGKLDQSGLIGQLDKTLGGALKQAVADQRFTGKQGSAVAISGQGKTKARWIVLAGLGSGDIEPETIRRAWGAAAKTAQAHGGADLASAVPPIAAPFGPQRAIAEATEGIRLAVYAFNKHRGAASKKENRPVEVSTLAFYGDDNEVNGREGISRGEAVAGAIELARDLVNEPASVLNPLTMADEARRVAKEQNLEIEVLGPDEMEARGMGAILAVGKGSAVPPRLIHLTYRPDGAGAGTRSVGLVGKCITFDTGGYSIKPYEGMLEMKSDMGGGAAVLGAMSALRALGVQHEVHGVICAAENMISGEAFRPGDILTASNGVTIEVLSTDAEGRLVLADGLVFTAKQGVDEMIDLATLTGAIVVALGEGTAGLFSNNDDLAERIEDAAELAGERVWRMPLTPELHGQIDGEVGDIKNTGGRPGGAITAALFLEHFSEGLPWAHLDIAGAVRASKAAPGGPAKGAVGFGVRTLLEYLLAE
jgi:leucyl aminopeptidase